MKLEDFYDASTGRLDKEKAVEAGFNCLCCSFFIPGKRPCCYSEGQKILISSPKRLVCMRYEALEEPDPELAENAFKIMFSKRAEFNQASLMIEKLYHISNDEAGTITGIKRINGKIMYYVNGSYYSIEDLKEREKAYNLEEARDIRIKEKRGF